MCSYSNLKKNEMEEPFCFVKFGENIEHIEKLQNGYVFFNNISKYRESIKPGFSDCYEGSFKITNNMIEKITCFYEEYGSLELKPINNETKLIEAYNGYLSFSIYGLSRKMFDKNNEFFIDKRMKEFGDCALMINKPDVFIENLKNVFIERGINYSCGWIKYLDFKKNGVIETDFFNKDESFNYQREFRFIIHIDSKEGEEIKIPSLQDFSVISSSKDVINAKFNLEKSRNGK